MDNNTIMTTVSMTISAFADEIAEGYEDQLKTLNDLSIPQLDLRTAWGVRVDNLSDEQVKKVNELNAEHNVTVACLGSPIGKSPLEAPDDEEIERLKRISEIAHQVGTKNVRMFSFYPNGTVNHTDIPKSIDRLQRLTDEAARLDVNLLLENEKHLVGDIPERVHQILETIDSPRLRLIWDPANFVQCGVANQVDNWWDKLHPYIAYIHIKDALHADGSVRPAGEGDGQVEKLLQKLVDTGYDGVLSLEPHLKVAGHSGGFSGPELMEVAVDALRGLMEKVGISEA